MKTNKKLLILGIGTLFFSTIFLFNWNSKNPSVSSSAEPSQLQVFDFASSNTAFAQDNGEDHGHGQGHIPIFGRFTSKQNGQPIWPPQMKNIKNVKWDQEVGNVRVSRATTSDFMKEIALQASDVQPLLGERYTFIQTVPLQEKWEDEISGHVVTFFSYSNNLTIEAMVNDGAVTNIETFAADVKQPPLRNNEVEAAIVIARKYWQDKGFDRVNDLEGFTIQTLKTEGEGGFYDTRMTYVSFHLNSISKPELLTWVDLTNETVYRAATDNEGVINEQ